ncbi:MAG: hypothetical protein ACHQZQ_05055, partial [SAR324 cluster bacterium]
MVAHPGKRTIRALARGTGSTAARPRKKPTNTSERLREETTKIVPRALAAKRATTVARLGTAKRRPARRTPRIASFLVQHAQDALFVRRGLRSFWEYRDLGIAEATGGRYGGFIVRSNHAGSESTGIHFHSPDVQLIYVLKGWLKAEYRGQGTVTLQAGTMLH